MVRYILFSNGPFLNVAWMVINIYIYMYIYMPVSKHNVPKCSDKGMHDRWCIDSIFEMAGHLATQTFLTSWHNLAGLTRTPVDIAQNG